MVGVFISSYVGPALIQASPDAAAEERDPENFNPNHNIRGRFFDVSC